MSGSLVQRCACSVGSPLVGSPWTPSKPHKLFSGKAMIGATASSWPLYTSTDSMAIAAVLRELVDQCAWLVLAGISFDRPVECGERGQRARHSLNAELHHSAPTKICVKPCEGAVALEWCPAMEPWPVLWYAYNADVLDDKPASLHSSCGALVMSAAESWIPFSAASWNYSAQTMVRKTSRWITADALHRSKPSISLGYAGHGGQQWQFQHCHRRVKAATSVWFRHRSWPCRRRGAASLYGVRGGGN